jgi:hypothetical protein
MVLRRIAVENYRCFRDRQELEIFPVTVVLGKNNSGKSALVRAPLIFSTGFGASTTAPLDLEHLGPDSVDGFSDLIFEQNPHGRIRVEVDVDGDDSFSLKATIQHVDRSRDAFVSDIEIQIPGASVGLKWLPEVGTSEQPRRYVVGFPDGDQMEGAPHFNGLLPLLPMTPEVPGAQPQGFFDRLSLGPMRYLSSNRTSVVRHHRLPLGEPQALGARGEGVPAVLAHDRARGGGELIKIVNRHLESIVPGWQLDEAEVGPLFATVLGRRSSPGLKVNLADAGAGLAQVLPILVQCALDEVEGHYGQPALQIIEEPEMHLHPAAHAELADLYLRTARATGTRFLIETHSETLLLRLRRRIAESDNEYGPDMVGIFVVDQRDGVSTVRRVSLDSLGNLGDEWPGGYFLAGL